MSLLAMRCPRCASNEWTCVLNTHHRLDGSIRRRHGCRNCQIRWTSQDEVVPGSLVAAFVPRPTASDSPDRSPQISTGTAVASDTDSIIGTD